MDFNKESRSLLLKFGISSFLTGTFLPLTILALKNNDARWACLYSALTTFFASYTFLNHAELTENRRILHDEMVNAENIYQNKMGHIHTRHYMNDIAKFMMAGFEQIAEQYFTTTQESQNALPNDKNQQ